MSGAARYNIVVEGGAPQQGQGGGFIVPGRGLQTVEDLRAEAEKRLRKRGALRDGDSVACLKVPVGGILSALDEDDFLADILSQNEVVTAVVVSEKAPAAAVSTAPACGCG